LIPNSEVVFVDPANGVKQNAVTGNDGVFTFAAVPVGQYELDLTAEGFNSYRQTDKLKIDVNTALTVDVVLQVADTSQTVNVVESPTEVRTTDTQIGQTIESKQLVDIPLNGRSYMNLLAVQAGVSPVTTGGAGSTSSGGGFGTMTDNSGALPFPEHKHVLSISPQKPNRKALSASAIACVIWVRTT
jgi:hypothetical protein